MRKENLVVTCSGGETSMVVTLYCLKYLQDRYNILVIFANTGVESNKTLEFLHRCELEFNIPIHWIEARVYHNRRKSCGYYKVDYKTATRNSDWKLRDNTPFEEVIKKYGLPNHSRLHCTRELKMNPIKAYAKDYFVKLDFQGWCIEHGREGFIKSIKDGDYKLTTAFKDFNKKYKQKYTLALGIRVDEIDRINPKYKELGIVYPLAQKEYKPMTKKQVNFFWEAQPFRLDLKGYEGNCMTCYKKSDNKLYQTAENNQQKACRNQK